MKKLFKLTALASAVFLLGACADETVLNPEQAREAAPESNAIQFGTYMGKTATTRAGYTGGITTEVLKDQAKANGFGVFAYYTETFTYAQFQKAGTSGPEKLYNDESAKTFKTTEFWPNFMYNQHVYYDAANSQHPSITGWVYSPVKYWPNEVVQGADYGAPGVDDQNKDKDNDPAIATGGYGGNVSFFAYAPYVNVTASSGEAESSSYSALSGTAFEGNSGILAFTKNNGTGDPKVAYKIPAKGETVDLLWGTKGNTDMNVNNTNNAGVKGDDDPSNDAAALQYVHAILKDYALNADLTKQTTTGKIEFAFKHATSKVGGSYEGSGEGDDDDPSTPTGGLMIVLDLDQDGAEVGGELEPFGDGANATTKYKTKVTVKNIIIESSEAANVTTATGTANGITTDAGVITNIDYATTWTKALHNQGVFNLATGQWSNTVKTADFKWNDGSADHDGLNHTITSPASSDDEKALAAANLSNEIAEPSSVTKTVEGFKAIPLGVTTTPKNVYEGEASPLVFLPDLYPVLHVTVEYIVRTYDPNLKNGYSEVAQKIKKRLVFTKKTELNKAYNLLIHLGLTSVKFTAYVSDWDSEGLTATTTTNPNTGDIITLYQADEDVWNPINVGMTVTALDVTGANASPSAAVLTTGTYNVSSVQNTMQLTATADLKSNEGKTYDDVVVTNEASYVSDVNWISVSSTGLITVDEWAAIQATTTNRTGHVTVTYGDQSKVITVNQAPRTVTALTLTPVKTTVNANEAPVSYTLIATVEDGFGDNVKGYMNTAYDATTESYYLVSDKKWATIDKVNKKVVIAKYTNKADDRTATLNAKFYGVSAPSVGITQSKATLGAIGATSGTNSLLNLSINGSAQTPAASYAVPAKGGTVTVNGITAQFTSDPFTQNGSNIKLTNPTSDGWFSISGNTINVDQNITSTAKAAATIRVNFKDENGVEQQLDFTITQKGISEVSALTVNVKGTNYTTDETITVPSTGGSYNINSVLATLTDGTDTFNRNAVSDSKVTSVDVDVKGHTWVTSSGSGASTVLTFGNNTTSDISDVTMKITVTYETSKTKAITLTFKQAMH